MLAALLLLAATAAATPRTVRVDYVHSGNATEERWALDGVALEGPWPGPLTKAIDTTGFGERRVEVRDAKDDTLLYSRGFATVFGEWQTTAEAKTVSRAFHESVRFPDPGRPVKVAIHDRTPGAAALWTVNVDPSAPSVDRAAPPAVKVWAVMQNGEPADKVDLLLLGDGYTAGEMAEWHKDARRLTEILFAQSPFKERRKDFNVWAIDLPADESGVNRPSDGVFRRSPLRSSYDAFGSERYVLTFDDKRLREIAAAAPYEFLEIVVNDRKYGGGGIHDAFATVSAQNAFTPYVFVHEFGHHFAGLADEYYTSESVYEAGDTPREPWEPNVTTSPQAAKWRDLVTPGVPLATPWDKERFEQEQARIQARRKQIRADKRPESEMEALFTEERTLMTKLLGSGKWAGAVGAFEGAAYHAKGYYRAQADCIMFTRDEVGFCAACSRAIKRVIDLYTR